MHGTSLLKAILDLHGKTYFSSVLVTQLNDIKNQHAYCPVPSVETMTCNVNSVLTDNHLNKKKQNSI